MPSLEGCAGDKIYNSQPIYLKLNGAYQVHSNKVLKLNKCGYFLKHIAHTHQTFKVSHELMLFRPSLNEVESMMVNNETRERSAQLGLILVSPSSSSCIIIFLWDFFFKIILSSCSWPQNYRVDSPQLYTSITISS